MQHSAGPGCQGTLLHKFTQGPRGEIASPFMTPVFQSCPCFPPVPLNWEEEEVGRRTSSARSSALRTSAHILLAHMAVLSCKGGWEMWSLARRLCSPRKCYLPWRVENSLEQVGGLTVSRCYQCVRGNTRTGGGKTTQRDGVRYAAEDRSWEMETHKGSGEGTYCR